VLLNRVVQLEDRVLKQLPGWFRISDLGFQIYELGLGTGLLVLFRFFDGCV
jgi:hypothetical protein